MLTRFDLLGLPINSLASLFRLSPLHGSFACVQHIFYPPWRDHPDGDPLWGLNLISFSFNVPLDKSFLISNGFIVFFWFTHFFIVTDGWWWMVDGGGGGRWWMVEKKVLRFR